MDKESRARFEKELTDEALKNLWNFARKRLAESRADSRDTPQEIDQKAWDAVMDAICDVLGGTRVWNEEAESDPIRFLAKAIRSEIYAANRRGDNSRSEDLPDEYLGEATILAIWPTIQTDLEADDLFMTLLQEVSGDQECESILWLIRSGFTKPREIAEEMQVDIDQIYVAKKRLIRKLAAFQEKCKVTHP